MAGEFPPVALWARSTRYIGLRNSSPLFDNLTEWLLRQAFEDKPLPSTVQQLGRRLMKGGLPVFRISIGVLVLHPNLGGVAYTWDADSDSCQFQQHGRAEVIASDNASNPFTRMMFEDLDFLRYRINDLQEEENSPILDRLKETGATDYIGFHHSYNRSESRLQWAGFPARAEGVFIGFATRRLSGFTEQEVDQLRTLSRYLSNATKLSTSNLLSISLLETYLGKLSGQNILTGSIQRGDGKVIDCALWYSDLRGSTAMAASLDLQSYMATINDYFDCTAGAAMEHGGEVLKFVGDGVMAIFPIDPIERPEFDMCQAAISAARDARLRLENINNARLERDLPCLEFGIGLHRGEVMYGNVGTQNRLDMTVTGPAANEVSRLESLCKRLEVPVLLSSRFNDVAVEKLSYMGEHDVPGVDDALSIYALAEFSEDKVISLAAKK